MAKYKNKTTATTADVTAFIHDYVEQEQKIKDSFELIKLLEKWSGFEARLWETSIIGFGSYHYKYKSGHEGDAPLLGFSPRKTAISLYVYSPTKEHEHILEDLGKYKMGKACIYVKKLSDISLEALEKICKATIAHLEEHHECACRKS